MDFKEASEKYGTTFYEEKEYALLRDAAYDGVQNLRINNSIYVLDSDNYSAPCMDEDGNEYIAYFVVTDSEAEPEDSCDWSEASYVTPV